MPLPKRANGVQGWSPAAAPLPGAYSAAQPGMTSYPSTQSQCSMPSYPSTQSQLHNPHASFASVPSQEAPPPWIPGQSGVYTGLAHAHSNAAQQYSASPPTAAQQSSYGLYGGVAPSYGGPAHSMQPAASTGVADGRAGGSIYEREAAHGSRPSGNGEPSGEEGAAPAADGVAFTLCVCADAGGVMLVHACV